MFTAPGGGDPPPPEPLLVRRRSRRRKSKNFHFHDLRHTFASRVPCSVAATCIRCKSSSGTRRPRWSSAMPISDRKHLQAEVERLAAPAAAPACPGGPARANHMRPIRDEPPPRCCARLRRRHLMVARPLFDAADNNTQTLVLLSPSGTQQTASDSASQCHDGINDRTHAMQTSKVQ